MTGRSLILLLSLQCVLHTCSHGFVLRKRSASWDENSLAEALQVIERERRRLEVPQDDDDVFQGPSWEHGDGDGGDELLGSLIEGDGSYVDDDTDSSYPLYPASDVYSDEYQGLENEVRPPNRKRSSPLQDEEELKSILQSSDDERGFASHPSRNLKKKSISNNEFDERQYDLDYKKRLYDPSREDFGGYEKKSKNSDTEEAFMNAAEVSKLLDQVENAEKQVIAEEVAESEEASEDTNTTGDDGADADDVEHDDGTVDDDMPTKEELETVLKDDDDADDDKAENETEDKMSTSDESTPAPPKVITVTKTEEKEWPDINAKGVSVTRESMIVQPGNKEVSIKRKRSGRSQDGSIGTDEDQSEAATSKEETAVEMAREYIRAFLKLEDDENNNLANALNLATISQIQRTDKFIPQEIQYLKKAILDEQMIQKLNSIAKSQITGDEEEPALEGTQDNPEADILPSLETPDDGDVPDIVSSEDGTSDENIDESLVRKRADPEDLDLPEGVEEEDLKNLFKQYLIRNAGMDNDDVNESPGKWYEEPVPSEKEGASKEEFADDDISESDSDVDDTSVLSPDAEDEVTDALAEYVEELKPSERRELTAAVEDKLAEETCPAVRKLSDNCAFMERFKFSIDAEARNLCNRHQMCYACGGIYDRSRHDCDAGYLAEAESLCGSEEDSEGCKEDAAGLFMMMVKAHSFKAPSSVDRSCSSPCVMSYVFGNSSK